MATYRIHDYLIFDIKIIFLEHLCDLILIFNQFIVNYLYFRYYQIAIFNKQIQDHIGFMII